jgi:2,4-dienoyl-CoA reductase-like NADH-dependent reductase (Old Yellow Enzyme family)
MGTLDQAFSMNEMIVKNRILRSATMENMADSEGHVTSGLLKLYYLLSTGGAGLIVTGAAAVERSGRVWNHQLAVWDDQCLGGLTKLAKVIHAYGEGCKCAVQLHHGGVSGYGYSYGGKQTKFSLDDAPHQIIEKTIASFGEAALRVKRAGFDAVGVHAAHGYLISQFLTPVTNHRTDEWGGSLENRMRFALGVVRSIRDSVGEKMPILWKMNCDDYHEGGQGIGEYAMIAGKLVEDGVDLIELSGGLKDQMKLRAQLAKEVGHQEAYFRRAIQPFRDAIGGKALAITGGIRSLVVMEALLNQGVEFIGMCRPLICEPDLPRRLLVSPDKRTAKCTSCSKCLLRIAREPVKCVEFDEFERMIKNL